MENFDFGFEKPMEETTIQELDAMVKKMFEMRDRKSVV